MSRPPPAHVSRNSLTHISAQTPKTRTLTGPMAYVSECESDDLRMRETGRGHMNTGIYRVGWRFDSSDSHGSRNRHDHWLYGL